MVREILVLAESEHRLLTAKVTACMQYTTKYIVTLQLLIVNIRYLLGQQSQKLRNH